MEAKFFTLFPPNVMRRHHPYAEILSEKKNASWNNSEVLSLIFVYSCLRFKSALYM
jgi:hypothetical protein